jgi:hypothetical protein
MLPGSKELLLWKVSEYDDSKPHNDNPRGFWKLILQSRRQRIFIESTVEKILWTRTDILGCAPFLHLEVS